MRLYYKEGVIESLRLRRASLIIASLFFIVSLFHSMLFVESSIIDFLVLLIIYLPILIFLCFFVKKNASLTLPNANLVLVFWLIGFFGKAISRFGYLQALISTGNVYLVRNLESLSQGGWYSYLSILFYPALLLMIISNHRYKYSFAFYFVSMAILLLDLVFLSMRMVPVFILFIWFIIFLSRAAYTKIVIRIITFAIVFIPVFMITTQNKSYDGDELDWNRHLKYTISTEVVKLKQSVIEIDKPNMVGASLFLSHYVYHSIGEFSNYLQSSYLNYSDVSPNRTFNQFCPVLKCSFENEIRYKDRRYGVYKTFHYSLISDFGLVPYLVFLLLLSIIVLVFFIYFKYNSVHVLILALVILSPIENFLYTGLGLMQFLMIFMMLFVSFLFNLFIEDKGKAV